MLVKLMQRNQEASQHSLSGSHALSPSAAKQRAGTIDSKHLQKPGGETEGNQGTWGPRQTRKWSSHPMPCLSRCPGKRHRKCAYLHITSPFENVGNKAKLLLNVVDRTKQQLQESTRPRGSVHGPPRLPVCGTATWVRLWVRRHLGPESLREFLYLCKPPLSDSRCI